MSTQTLVNKSKNVLIANQVWIARSFWDRTKGLLGKSSLPAGQGLWIQGSDLIGCNSIHTFFMRFAIDAVFVDRELKVKKVYRSLSPWRVTLPASGAHSVFEFSAGTLARASVEVGDQLHVGN